MLITFKSPACGDVIMHGDDGKQLLRLLGKDPDAAMGVVTVDQLPDAIAVLKRAVAEDKASRKAQPDAAGHVDMRGPAKVRLAQRALPLIELLERSLAEKATVTWGV